MNQNIGKHALRMGFKLAPNVPNVAERGFRSNPSLFEFVPIFFGEKSGEIQTFIGGVREFIRGRIRTIKTNIFLEISP